MNIDRALGIDVETLAHWHAGAFRSADDEMLLSVVADDNRVLVSYDCRTLPARLRLWADAGRSHAGVVLVDARTIRPADAGSLARALAALAEGQGSQDWHDRVVFLRRA